MTQIGPRKELKLEVKKQEHLLFFTCYWVCPEWDFIRGKDNMFTVVLLLTECTIGFLHQIVCCVFKVGAEMPSVPGRPGTSSLPT